MERRYSLQLTTQGPLYPPSEVMDEAGNFIVIGAVNRVGTSGLIKTEWGGAIVSPASTVPEFGDLAPYDILEEFDPHALTTQLRSKILHTLPLPLPCNNYGMIFAPNQYPYANNERRNSYPFHLTPIPDAEWLHGRQLRSPVTLGDWVKAKGELVVSLENDGREARFSFAFTDLIPRSLYTIMTLRENDLAPGIKTRPGPLGIPNVMVTDELGSARFDAVLPDPFPPKDRPGNRVINIVVLFMSYQMSHGGAIGRYGLGGDIHAHLKLTTKAFDEFETKPISDTAGAIELNYYTSGAAVIKKSSTSFAFFDVDDTLIRTKSMFDFYRFFCTSRGLVEELQGFEACFSRMFSRNYSREELNREYYRYYAGTSPKEVSEAARAWWLQTSQQPGIFIKESCDLLRTLQGDGVTAVFVSGSFKELLTPIGEDLSVTEFLCAPMQTGSDGLFDGSLGQPQTIGFGKAQAVKAFLRDQGVDPSVCWAVGDDLSDVPMLEAVGHKVAVGYETPLTELAARRGWSVLLGQVV